MPTKLSGLDSAMLAVDTTTTPMHVSALTILEPREGREAAFEEIRAQLEPRLRSLDVLRRHVRKVPMGLDHPRWVEDDFDLDAHMKRMAVPAPGSLAELSDVCATLAALPLDPIRPLWEIWVIEGLRDGRTALFTKIHHCLIDGTAGVEIFARLFDSQPDVTTASIEEPAAPEQRSSAMQRRTAGDAPSSTDLLKDGLRSLAARPGQLVRETARSTVALAGGLRALVGNRSPGSDADSNGHGRRLLAPDTPLNGAISTRRSVAFASVPLADVLELRRRHGVKVNDVVLAILTGALRRYLERENGAPDEPMRAAIPVSTDTSTSLRTCGNEISAVIIELPVQLGDPTSRLAHIARATLRAKHAHRATGGGLLAGWAELAPPALVSSLARLYAGLDLADLHRPVANLVVSNVSGPATGLYCAGHRIESCYPLGPIFEGVGLNATVLSYDGDLHLGLAACAKRVRHVDALARDFEQSAAELRWASQSHRAGAGPRTSSSGRASATHRKRRRSASGEGSEPASIASLAG